MSRSAKRAATRSRTWLLPLGKMTVTANVPGRKLKNVYVQTSLNGRDFRTVGQWRADGKATFVP